MSNWMITASGQDYFLDGPDSRNNGLWPIIDAAEAAVSPWGDVDLNTASRKRASWDDWREAFLREYRELTGKVNKPTRRAA